MSKGFIGDGEKFRIGFPDGEWIDIKSELSQADNDYILSKMTGMKAGKTDIDVNLGQLPLLERSIVAWSFTEPVNRDNISQLRTKYRILVLKEINRLNAEAQDFAKN